MQRGYTDLFAGKRILVVEDEYFLSDETRQRLDQLDVTILGPAVSTRDAFAIIEEKKVDAAILDVYIADHVVFPIAEKLEDLEIPFVFAAGDAAILASRKYSGFIFCERTDELDKIAKALFSSRLAEELH